jgi:hypothetical protein
MEVEWWFEGRIREWGGVVEGNVMMNEMARHSMIVMIFDIDCNNLHTR